MSLYIGLMSGTSMDGIDAALIDMPSNILIHGITQNYSKKTKLKLNELLANMNLSFASICELNGLIGRDFASAVLELLNVTGKSTTEIEAIGSHGQTICHDTSGNFPYTLQLGCGHTISSLTGITVVADFRTRDIVNGGQGAPFAPLYHQELFSKRDTPIAIINVGGISNISLISDSQETKGWDIGPGNCLMDAWIYLHQNKAFDNNGAWASQGKVIDSLLDNLLSDPFFSMASPKSIGKEYFSLAWLEQHHVELYKPEDVQATLLRVTAQAIADTVLKEHPITHVYLCGGGTHNIHLHRTLNSLLPGVIVKSIIDVGVSPDYLEAMMFAW
ncbi:MAG: anhydro-N-acetylmuramic acid kinase, partial [bacterium]|nr:anhydro-N-acetylmuramic acid kinase [bacterium]